jgi:hypothetical protein
MKTYPLLSLLLLVSAPISAQVPLFADGLERWSLENSDPGSFAFEQGVLRVSGDAGWLRSPEMPGNFELRGEVRFVEPDSDSGIFLRVQPGTEFIRGWPGNAYQVQMRDISVNGSDSPLPLANLYRHRVADGPTDYQREQVFELYSGVGDWQLFVIRAEGGALTVDLNDVRVTEASGLVNPTGYIGFQSEVGIVEYRNLALRELP